MRTVCDWHRATRASVRPRLNNWCRPRQVGGERITSHIRAGVDPPDAGRVRRMNRQVTAARRREVGDVGLDFEVWPANVVARYVATARVLSGGSASISLDVVKQLEALVAVVDQPTWSPEEVSGFVRYILAKASTSPSSVDDRGKLGSASSMTPGNLITRMEELEQWPAEKIRAYFDELEEAFVAVKEILNLPPELNISDFEQALEQLRIDWSTPRMAP